jgi:hypothetical protein
MGECERGKMPKNNHIQKLTTMKLLEAENDRLSKNIAELMLRNRLLKDQLKLKLMSPSLRRRSVAHVVEVFGVSERKACELLDQTRSTQRYEFVPSEGEQTLIKQIVEIKTKFPSYGYRRITALLQHRGWAVNHKRVERISRQERLKVLNNQPGSVDPD